MDINSGYVSRLPLRQKWLILTQVFKCLRKQHPALQANGHRAQDIEGILNALNTILSAMNPIRNRASVALE
jgi:hypothetical protein